MITTEEDDLAERVRCLRDHGATISDLQRHSGPRPYLLADHPDAGYNQRMTDLQGALGSAQMNRAEAIITERQRLASVYDDVFDDLEWLQTPVSIDGFEHGYQSYPCLFQPEMITVESVPHIHESRNAWMEQMQQQGVSTRPATHAVHMLSYYREKYNFAPEKFPNSYAANHCSFSLPLFHGMTEAEQNHVIEQVRASQF